MNKRDTFNSDATSEYGFQSTNSRKYTLSLNQANDDELYKSFMNQSLSESVNQSSEDDENELDKLIYYNVCIPLNEAKSRMPKNDGPYMPMTVSLYRTVAFKMFSRQFANK